ncbi:MAG: twitching motility protein PilT [Actinomycetota bacterium]|nr:twitching motility protein PilT [Actinomycetota bacterium]
MAGLTYDAGALLAAGRDDRRIWALHRRALQRQLVPRVPAAVVTQAWRGKGQAQLARFLNGCEVVALDRRRSRRAGQLLAAAGNDAVDATVVELASERADTVVTSDRRDIELIADANRLRLSILDV